MQTPVAPAQSIVWLYSSSREPIFITYDMVQAKDKYKEEKKEKEEKKDSDRERNRKKESDKASERGKRKKEREKEVRLDGY